MTFQDSSLRLPFTICAIMNIIGAVSSMLMPDFHLKLFYNLTPDVISDILYLYHQMFWSVVLVMGVAYYIMAQNPRGHQGILLIGGVGKISAVLAWGHALYHYGANAIVWGGIVWDGAWGVFFFVLLWQYYREGASTLIVKR